MKFPTHAQRVALLDFRTKYGRTWKAKLCQMWSNGGDDAFPLLRQVRNQFGPLWLNKVNIDKIWKDQLDIVAKHYLIAAIWADAPEGTSPRVTKASREAAEQHCFNFIGDNLALFEEAMARYDGGYGIHPDAGSAEAAFGHDLWLTKCGHGAGFWDRKELREKDLGDRLAKACRGKEPNYWFAHGWFHLARI